MGVPAGLSTCGFASQDAKMAPDGPDLALATLFLAPGTPKPRRWAGWWSGRVTCSAWPRALRQARYPEGHAVSPRSRGKLSPDDFAPVAGALPSPAGAERSKDGQPAPAFVIVVCLARLQVQRALVPGFDDEGCVGGHQPQGDRRSLGKA